LKTGREGHGFWYDRALFPSRSERLRKTVIKLSVMYPNCDGATFDMDYYCNRHMALVRTLLGAVLKGIAVDQGINQPEGPAPFVAAGHLLFDSVEECRTALNSHGAALIADIPNYTNTQPTVQFSEVRM